MFIHTDSSASQNPDARHKKKQKASEPNSVTLDGQLDDIELVTPSEESDSQKDKTLDIQHFYSEIYTHPTGRRMCDCTMCNASLVQDLTTCRRHLEARHKVRY